MNQSNILRYLPAALLTLIAISCILMTAELPFIGDDMRHCYFIGEKYRRVWEWPLVVPLYWLTLNGRMGDMLGATLLAHCPRWLLVGLCAGAEVLFYYMVVRWCRVRMRDCLACLGVMAVVMLGMPWWDSGFLFVCRINYVWALGLLLVALWMVLSRGGCVATAGWRQWPAMVLALVAGWMHESGGAPVAGALGVYIVYNGVWRRWGRHTRRIALALMAGGVLSVSSPMSWARAAGAHVADDVLWLLLLKSCPIGMVLGCVVLVLLCSGSGRARLQTLARGPWLVMALASAGGMVFVAVGGIVGRSGWFCETFGLIGLAWMLPADWAERVGRRRWAGVVSVVLFMLLGWHIVGSGVVQMEANGHLNRALELYDGSATGEVYYSAVHRDEMPWWTLGRTKAEVDNDDWWLVEVMDVYRGGGVKHYRLLPPELEGYRRGMAVPVGRVTDREPVVDRDSVAVEFGDGWWFVDRRVWDPGDR